MNIKPNLILDLDGTLLHPAESREALPVPGRTKITYIAVQTINHLLNLTDRFQIVLATARSWKGAAPVVEILERFGIAVSGIVLEDGALLGTSGNLRAFANHYDRHEIRKSLTDFADHVTDFVWQTDFEACLVARTSGEDQANALSKALCLKVSQLYPTLRCYTDGVKVYLLDRSANKWTALVKLLGESARFSAGIGDGLNDLCWLRQIALPCTLADAKPELVETVSAAEGIVAESGSHEGMVEILARLTNRDRRLVPGGSRKKHRNNPFRNVM